MLELNHISKVYRSGRAEFVALENIDLQIPKGEYLAIHGASGAGKSTLLNLIGGLVRPDSGEVLFEGVSLYAGNPRMLAAYRKRRIGFMFQQFHLMPWLTVFENVELACYHERQKRNIDNYLGKCNLSELRDKFPSGLSVGEKQRTAFVRAIITMPDILLADEPTGNLDPGNGRILMELVDEYNRNGGTVILVSHDEKVTEYARRVVTLERGKIAALKEIQP